MGTYNAAAGTTLIFDGGWVNAPVTAGTPPVLNGPGQYQFGSGYLLLNNETDSEPGRSRVGRWNWGRLFQDQDGAITNLTLGRDFARRGTLPGHRNADADKQPAYRGDDGQQRRRAARVQSRRCRYRLADGRKPAVCSIWLPHSACRPADQFRNDEPDQRQIPSTTVAAPPISGESTTRARSTFMAPPGTK